MEILIPETIEVEAGKEERAIAEIKAFFRAVYLEVCQEKGLETGARGLHPSFKIEKPEFLTAGNENRRIFSLLFEKEVIALVAETRNGLKIRFDFFLKRNI